jgi:hypothetical protein
MNCFYQIQHLGLSVVDPLGLLGDAIDKLLGPFRCPAPSSDHKLSDAIRLEVQAQRTSVRHCETLPLAWRGEYDGVRFAVYRQGGRRRVELPSGAVADFDVEGDWAHLCLPQPGTTLDRWFLLLRIVCESLKRGGHSFLHAACLAMPAGDTWRGVVLTAPSNTGKTTAALALSNSGWRLLGDDITYLRPARLGSGIWGFPRTCHLRPGTVRLMPWLADLELGQPDAEGVRTLHPAKLYERSWLGAPWLTPALVVVVAPHNQSETRVESIGAAEALTHLAAESLSAVPGVCDADAAQEFSEFAQLVALAPACRMSGGPDLDNVAGKLQQHLTERLSERSKHAALVGAA